MKLITLIIAISINFSLSAVPQCGFSDVTWVVTAVTYHCNIANQAIPDNIEYIGGNHLVNRTNKNVRGASIVNGVMQNFPQGFEKVYPNIEGILISKMLLKEIRDDDFINLPKIRILGFNGNRLKVIGENVFKHNPKLEYLDFRGNIITHFEPAVFNHLTILRYFYPNQNLCENPIGEAAEVVKAQELIKQIAGRQCVNEFYEKNLKLEEEIKKLRETKTLQRFNYENQKIDEKCDNFAVANLKMFSLQLEFLINTLENTCNKEEVMRSP